MREIKLDINSFLISETNSKGNITFANDEFCKIVGYSVDELIDKPHNIIRHPDMPKIAFKGLWDTIKDNKIWTGYVKNKTKNNDFYWVFATVFPIKKDGETRYLSCRRMASEEEIRVHDTLYKTLKDKE